MSISCCFALPRTLSLCCVCCLIVLLVLATYKPLLVLSLPSLLLVHLTFEAASMSLAVRLQWLLLRAISLCLSLVLPQSLIPCPPQCHVCAFGMPTPLPLAWSVRDDELRLCGFRLWCAMEMTHSSKDTTNRLLTTHCCIHISLSCCYFPADALACYRMQHTTCVYSSLVILTSLSVGLVEL